MKKLLIALLALGAIAFVPSAEARCRTKTCAPKVKKSCAKPCAPECTTEEHRQIVKEPCERWVLVPGTCDHEICTKVTTCRTQSKKCVSDCQASCVNAVNPADRGMASE